MPERSKGLDSSSSVFVLGGSNPPECSFFSDLIDYTYFGLAHSSCDYVFHVLPSTLEYLSELQQSEPCPKKIAHVLHAFVRKVRVVY